MRKSTAVALAFLVAGLAGATVGRLVAADAAKKPVVVWHTLTLKADADAKARDEMVEFLDGEFFPALAKSKPQGLIRFEFYKGSTAKVERITDDHAYQEPATYMILEVWKDAESARQFREELPEDLKRLSQELERKNPDSVFEHHFSMYDRVTATAEPAAQ
jgi:hypothetical protein